MGAALEISVQGTPNPQAVKFTLNRTIAAQGRTYRLPAAPPGASAGAAQAGDAASADAPWAGALLRIAGVTQVFALHNFISVTKAPEASWDAIVPQVERTLQQAFA
ncbi:MAG: NifU N-terminal domain-containing protein [Candidatus Omnitrophica bacterium]|nr:NifU N-terminal domain-containing protein [Candidatus Omnitrophota bacterium]